MAYGLDLTAPRPTIDIGHEGGLILAAPSVTVEITTYDSSANVNLVAPAPTLTIVAFNENVVSIALCAPSPTISILPAGGIPLAAPLIAPVPILVLRSEYTIGLLAVRAPPPSIEISGNNGTTDPLALIAPKPVIAITTSIISAGNPALLAPAPTLAFFTGGIIESTEQTALLREHACIVLNADVWEVTQYTWQFDQIVKFGTRYLGIDALGIHLLGGDFDNGEQIDAVIETGMDDFGILTSKRIAELCVGWKSSGDGIVAVAMDRNENEQYEYGLRSTNGQTDSVRVKVGKPRQRRYVNFIITNVGGVDFDFNGMDMVVSLGMKKTQGLG